MTFRWSDVRPGDVVICSDKSWAIMIVGVTVNYGTTFTVMTLWGVGKKIYNFWLSSSQSEGPMQSTLLRGV